MARVTITLPGRWSIKLDTSEYAGSAKQVATKLSKKYSEDYATVKLVGNEVVVEVYE